MITLAITYTPATASVDDAETMVRYSHGGCLTVMSMSTIRRLSQYSSDQLALLADIRTASAARSHAEAGEILDDVDSDEVEAEAAHLINGARQDRRKAEQYRSEIARRRLLPVPVSAR